MDEVANALLQGHARETDDPLYMGPSRGHGFLGLKEGQLLRVRNVVFGLPDAHLDRFEEFTNVLKEEFQCGST